jgi:alkanesulfonate monooxygenase SsuD/methylene tetrahydromethanopterin reductase-like flavin-dependent oxidoreductase (luciferase family)
MLGTTESIGGEALELRKLGVWCFTDALTPAQLRELAQHTERLGYGALWYVEPLAMNLFPWEASF